LRIVRGLVLDRRLDRQKMRRAPDRVSPVEVRGLARISKVPPGEGRPDFVRDVGRE
jgi:hypothetical protein